MRMVADGEVVAVDGSRLTFRVDTLCVHGDSAGSCGADASAASRSRASRGYGRAAAEAEHSRMTSPASVAVDARR